MDFRRLVDEEDRNGIVTFLNTLNHSCCCVKCWSLKRKVLHQSIFCGWIKIFMSMVYLCRLEKSLLIPVVKGKLT
jgi:hypothetical protein